MRIICASDSFKETITAAEASRAMARGVERTGAEADVCPIADGGEGTLDAIIQAMNGSLHKATVTGPHGEPVSAQLGISSDGGTGVVELAQASGLAIIPRDKRDPARTTTFGTGELIRLASQRGCTTVVLCIGGSGTCDGGAGIVQALGARFLDSNGNAITTPMSGGLLGSVARIERSENRNLPAIRIACDVTNPLCGERGSAAVYGPQKGATPEQVRDLDANLMHLAKLLNIDPDTPGFGAAGGAAVCPVALYDATMERGIELVLDTVCFHDRCRDADLVLTGEGRLDEQSLSGKATMGVAAAARECGVNTIAIVGATDNGAERCCDPTHGGLLHSFLSLSERFGQNRAMRETASLIEQVAHDLVAPMVG